MDEFIGRVRINDRMRAYRLPVRLPSETVHGIDPDGAVSMYRTTNDHRSRSLRNKLNRVAHRIRGHDVSVVQARAGGNYLKITLLDHPRRFIDHGNRFERIERVLSDEFSMEVDDIKRHKWFRW